MNEVDRKELRSEISRLNLVDLDIVDFDELVESIGRMVDGLPVGAHSIEPGKRLWRARKSTDILIEPHEFGAPDASKVRNNFQRCNKPGERMFYAAANPMTAIFEIGSSKGDELYLSAWDVDRRFFCNVIPPDKIGNENDHRIDLIATFFETAFRVRVHDDFSNEYKMTAAIADRMMPLGWTTVCNNTFPESIDHDAVNAGPVGLEYPSCATSGALYDSCYAIRPSKAHDHLWLNFVERIRILNIGDETVEFERIDRGQGSSNGSFKWEGIDGLIKKSKKSQLQISGLRQEGGWIMLDRDGNVF